MQHKQKRTHLTFYRINVIFTEKKQPTVFLILFHDFHPICFLFISFSIQIRKIQFWVLNTNGRFIHIQIRHAMVSLMETTFETNCHFTG